MAARTAANDRRDLAVIILRPLAALALLLSPLLTAGPTAVAQGSPVCEPDRVCLYENFGFGGQRWPLLPETADVGPAANDKASSVFNNTSGAVLLYGDTGFQGVVICLNPRAEIDNLALFGLNDTISSISSGPAGGCT